MEVQPMIQQHVESSGRCFLPDEICLIRQTVTTFSNLSLKELSQTLCELLEWRRPNGKLKHEECRALLERLQADGLVVLPKLRNSAAPFGAHLNYLVESPNSPGQFLACLQFSSPAWKMAPRDAWIGWSAEQRKRNLQFIVSNSRFLIPAYISIKGLASMTLSLAARRLPDDWERLYGYRPLLMETLVERDRFAGTVYKAANWVHLGCTQGRGRMDSEHAAHGKSIKDIYVYPLCRHAQAKLRNAVLPAFVDKEESEAFV